MRSLIIEDEERGRLFLESLITTYCPRVEIVGWADSVKTGIIAINEHQPELIFMDIHLLDGTGFEILEKVDDCDAALIFTTAYDQYALKAFKFSAIDYLLKPINVEELKDAVQRVFDRFDRNINSQKIHSLLSNIRKEDKEAPLMLVSTAETIEFIRIEDIIRCEAQGSYCMVYMKDKKPLLVSKVIKEFTFLLSDYSFYRVHQSHLINLKFVSKYLKGYNSLELDDGTRVQLARSRKDDFFQKLHQIKV